MTLLEDLVHINHRIEKELSIELAETDFEDGRQKLSRIYLHEACHAALTHCVPWICDLQEREHTAVDEVLTRLLEMGFGPSLGILVHRDQEFLEELERYSVSLAPQEFEHLKELWQAYFWPKRDLAGMAVYLLTLVRYGRTIYHILPETDWQIALKKGIYAPSSLEEEGFIHCSEIDQVLSSAQAYFSGQPDLSLLCIAVNQVLPRICYEGATAENVRGFPHIYGALNLEAVVNVSTLDVDERGDFMLPKYPHALLERGSKA